MNTPAHVLVAAAALAKPDAPRRNIVMVLGSLIPDALIFWMVFWEGTINGRSARVIFDELYFSDFWQRFFAIPNSIPLYIAGIALGLWLRIELLWVFCGAALLHVLGDLPLHHDDGHSHFWPFTMWKFESPVSYWDPGHHGNLVGALEITLCLALAALLWRRFKGPIGRALILGVMAMELLPVIGWILFFQ